MNANIHRYRKNWPLRIVGTFTILFLILATALVVRNVQESQKTESHASTSVQALLNSTKEINYYPTNAGWTYMWSNFNPIVIDTDFVKIQGLGFNTVRIILQAVPGAFDYPTPTTTELNHLSQVITLASNHNLKVHLTLFDWWGAYTDLTGSKQWADAIVKPYAADPRVSIIELQNEIDSSNTSAMIWAQTLIPYLKSIDGGIPVTISEYGQSRMQALYTALQTTPPDFWDYHIYGAGEGTYTSLQQVKTLVNGQPLFIGETGYSTYPQNGAAPYGLASNQLAQEAYQDYYYRTLFAATNGLALPSASSWIYSDFSSGAIPPNGTTDPAESYFGLYRSDGSAKPVVATVTSLLAGNPVDLSFNNSFENSDGNGLPTVWRIYQNASLGFTANFSRDTTVAHTGSASAKISNSTNNAAGTASFFLNPVQYILPGQTYTFSAWAKGTNATGSNNISVAWFDNNNNYLSQNFSPNLPLGTTAWQQILFTMTVPTNAAIAELHLNSANNTGAVWFDDVSFTQFGVTPTTIPTIAPSLPPTNTPTPALTSTPTRTPTPPNTPTPTLTATPILVSTKLSLTIGLDGIGKAGDNVSRTSTGNLSPLHPTRTVALALFDVNNNPLPTITGQLTYDSVSGLFKGTVSLPSTVGSGVYTLKVSTPSFLLKALPGILTLTTGQTTTVPTTDLTAGDINNDNQISLLDYNQLLSCFGSSASICTPSDLDDDGTVGGSDYNLFLRELSVQIGG